MFESVSDTVVVAIIGVGVAIVSAVGNVVVAIITNAKGKKAADTSKKLDKFEIRIDNVFDNIKTINSNMSLLNDNFKSFQALMVELVTTKKPPETAKEKVYAELEPLVELTPEEPEGTSKQRTKKKAQHKKSKLGLHGLFSEKGQIDIITGEPVGPKVTVMGHPAQGTMAIKK